METVLKAVAVCIPAALIAAVIRKENPAMALVLAVSAGGVVLYLCVSSMRDTVDYITILADGTGIDSPALSAVLKTAGIAVITRFASDVCDESGMRASSTAVNLAGSTAALITAMPLLKTVFQMISGLM